MSEECEKDSELIYQVPHYAVIEDPKDNLIAAYKDEVALLHSRIAALYESRIAALEAELSGARSAALSEAVKICWDKSDELLDRDDMTSEQGMAQECASAIRSLIFKPGATDANA